MEQKWSEFELCVRVNVLDTEEENALRTAVENDVQVLRGNQRIGVEPNEPRDTWIVFHEDDFIRVLYALTHMGYEFIKRNEVQNPS